MATTSLADGFSRFLSTLSLTDFVCSSPVRTIRQGTRCHSFPSRTSLQQHCLFPISHFYVIPDLFEFILPQPQGLWVKDSLDSNDSINSNIKAIEHTPEIRLYKRRLFATSLTWSSLDPVTSVENHSPVRQSWSTQRGKPEKRLVNRSLCLPVWPSQCPQRRIFTTRQRIVPHNGNVHSRHPQPCL